MSELPTSWRWLVSHGYWERHSILVDASAPCTIDRWTEKHPSFEVFKRPAGHHWDGERLSDNEIRRCERRIKHNLAAWADV